MRYVRTDPERETEPRALSVRTISDLRRAAVVAAGAFHSDEEMGKLEEGGVSMVTRIHLLSCKMKTKSESEMADE